MSDLSIFAFESSAVRSLLKNGEPWFVASDIANILGYKHTPHMIRMLDEDETGVHIVDTLGGNQEVSIIAESGLYACILKSRRPEAKTFRKWVTSEVLPAIRKTGTYIAPDAVPGPVITGNLAHAADIVVSADRVFRGFLRSARNAGLSLPKALRLAGEQTRQRTGLDMLHELEINPDEMASTSAPSEPDDALAIALRDWAETAERCREYRLRDILDEAMGYPLTEKVFQRIGNKAAQVLGTLGLRCNKVRKAGGGQGNVWSRE